MEIISLAIILNLLVLLFLFSLVEIATAVPPLALPGCDSKCGVVEIPYPFGLREGCFSNPYYNIKCDAQNGKPYYDGMEVLKISLLKAHLVLRRPSVSNDCFDNRRNGSYMISYGYSVGDSPFRFSSTRNKLIGIGCNTVALLTSNFSDDANFSSGCISLCDKLESVINGSCSGIGCCQTSIPSGLKEIDVFAVKLLYSQVRNSSSWKFNPCSFAFIGAYEYFTFESSYLSREEFDRSEIPVVLDWAIGKIGNKTCGPNSYSSKSMNALGYNCTCKDGFEGNPYLPVQGCQDINECESTNNCDTNAICKNTYGNYTCQCREGYRGDGMLYRDRNRTVHGSGCTKDMTIIIVAGAGAGFVGLSAFVWVLNWAIQRKRRQREKFFNQNGGQLLQQQIASKKGEKDIAKIFSSKALNKATNNFHESQIIGEGGFGRVYQGTLSSGKVVAIKKSKIVDKGQIIQFINEVDILSQINHRHVVKLLGCCLEIEVPLLVYEFISNGTLSEHIHRKNETPSLSWGNRLRIATETADALAYLHSSHVVPIFHRDVKSSNILLDDKYRAKVSDFGASRLVPLDETQKMTQIQGTHGYLDPECLLTGQLTDKSDVYSFGVVLLELLTGKKPLLFEEFGVCTTLVSYFLSSMKDGNLFNIIDDRILIDGKREQLLAVAELARDCLKDKREDRPTMKEVARELDSLKMFYERSSAQHNQETEPFLGEPSTSPTNATIEIEMNYSVTDYEFSLVAR